MTPLNTVTSNPERVLRGAGPAARTDQGKPPYRVPSMAEVAAIRGTNGYRVVSTFSGCGGSCLGFEMAGFEVVYACEFDPAAFASYKPNHPGVPVDTRSVRDIPAADILARLNLRRGELDVLEGSPPCSKFSMAGKRAKSWGKVTGSDSSITQANVEDLFFEYVRLVDDLQPKVFSAENVPGLGIGVAKGYLKEIIARLRGCGYRVRVGELDAQWLGVPQRRRRFFFVGVRDDLGIDPRFPTPFPYRYTVSDAWADLPAGSPTPGTGEGLAAHHAAGQELRRMKPGSTSGRYFSMSRCHPNEPAPTVLAGMGGGGTKGVFHPTAHRKISIPELKRVCSFPDDFHLAGTYAQQWARCGNAVPPLMAKAVADTIRTLLNETTR